MVLGKYLILGCLEPSSITKYNAQLGPYKSPIMIYKHGVWTRNPFKIHLVLKVRVWSCTCACRLSDGA